MIHRTIAENNLPTCIWDVLCTASLRRKGQRSGRYLLRNISRNSSRSGEKNNETLQSGQLASRPTFEHLRIWVFSMSFFLAFVGTGPASEITGRRIQPEFPLMNVSVRVALERSWRTVGPVQIQAQPCPLTILDNSSRTHLQKVTNN
jgi:hypothetical protein